MGTVIYTNCEPWDEAKYIKETQEDGIEVYAKSLLEDDLTNAREGFQQNGYTQELLLEMFPNATEDELEEAIEKASIDCPY